MPPLPSPLHSSIPRLTLRASLLAGALVDLAFAVTVLASSLGFHGFDSLLADGVSYSRQLAAPLVCRAALQILACYDRQRYDSMIPFTALTLIGSGIASYGEAGLRSAAIAMLLIGGSQLISHRLSRR